MNDTKFTKGKWLVNIQGLDSFQSVAVMVEGGGFEVTNIPDAKANAHLIAAAPDMYAMIESLSKELQHAIDEVNGSRLMQINSLTETPPDMWDKESLHDAQALLAKARGD